MILSSSGNRVPIVLVLFCLSAGSTCIGQPHFLDSTMHHLRNAEPREWSEFPVRAEGSQLTLPFPGRINATEITLRIRQYDVKQDWKLLINGRETGTLVGDEKDMITYFAIPPGTLRDGDNVIQIKCNGTTPDDINVGNIMLDDRLMMEVLSEAGVEITITDGNSGVVLPGRITITNGDGILQTVTSPSMEKLALRPGYVYTGNGTASINLPAGTYTLYAGRGFEYGIDSLRLELKPGQHVQHTFRIKREVPTAGWISCDTHIHTFTHSRHGDATLEDRALTIAGEGIELAILTDHNIDADLEPAARAMQVDSHFTPVTGNEVTTKVGHFNVFQTVPGSPVIDHQVDDWNSVATAIDADENAGVIILNHARDIHNAFRPFDPGHHLSAIGAGTRGWKFPANAMEVINSGSQQTDIMALYRDWFGMLNRGYFLTPAGSSDSHDVSRYTVGQGRTYIQSKDDDPSNININTAIKNFREGRVMVSLGLLTKITVNDSFGPGEVVPPADQVTVAVEVCGPSWARASRVELYANGKLIREETIKPSNAAGIKWKGSWMVPLPAHDIFLVAIADGPGDGMPYWPIAKPYQPASPDWQPRLMGSTGAVWIDVDGNGRANCAYDYARQIVDSSDGDINTIVERLYSFDEAVAAQVAGLLWSDSVALTSPEIVNAMQRATPATKSGFDIVIEQIFKNGNTSEF